MWALTNHTPFPAEVGAYRDQHDQAFWGVWLAASFQLRPDLPPLYLGDQPALRPSPEFGENGVLIGDAEMVPQKDKVDLLISGHAIQPAHDAKPLAVSVKVGGWSKALEVHPPLRWGLMGRARVDYDAQPARVSLDGVDSFGGEGHDANPLGRGHGLTRRLERGQEVADVPPPPTVLPVGDAPAKRGDPAATAALGPLSPVWPIRSALAGTYDDTWEARRAPMLPSDFDPAYWQTAPSDQRLNRPLPKPPVLDVVGFDAPDLNPMGTRLPLPSLSLRCDTKVGSRWVGAPAEVQSLAIDLDTLTLRATYHARWQLAQANADVDIAQTVIELSDTSDFRVPPEYVELFHLRPSQRQVAL